MNTIERVSELIKERNMSLYQLARTCGVPYATLKNAQDRCNQLSVETIRSICIGLGITLSDFFANM